MHSKHIQRASRWQLVLAVLACLAFSKWSPAQTVNPDAPKKPKFDITKPLGDTYAAASSVAIEQSRLVIYRPRTSDEKSGVISVYINDRYHTALQQDAFSVVCFDTTKAQLRTRLINAQGELQPELDTRNALGFKRGESLYLRVTDLKNGRTRMDIVPANTASQDLSQARQQKHAISRVPEARPCKQDPGPVITFGSDTVFEPQETTLTPAGEKELSQIVDKINSKYKNLDGVKVHIVGYADDTPEEPHNERLSLARAQSVRTYLINSGLRTEALTHEGRGSKDKNLVSAMGRSGRRVEVAVAVELH